MADQTPAAAPGPSIATLLATERTDLAHERTLMAWIRTATSLISFGFTIYKFFQFERGEGLGPATQQLIGPHHFAMIMITLGVVSLVLATIQHWVRLRGLRRQGLEVPYSLAILVAGLISIFGVLALVAVILRM